MRRYLVSRVLQMIPVLVGISLVAFLGLHLVPGDVVQMILGDKATPEAVARLRAQLGLNDPVWVQYGRFLVQVLHGSFGQSLRTHRPATYEVLAAFPVTLQLSFLALIVATVVGIWLGIVSALHRGRWGDAAAMVVALFGISMPVFWVALLLMLLGGVFLHLLPIAGLLDPGDTIPTVTGIQLLDALITGDWGGFLDVLRHLVLPVLALATLPMGVIARVMRASILEAIGQDYVRTAYSKGLASSAVIYRHALRNALIPVVTVIATQLGTLLSGAVLTETVFGLPGLGRLAVTSILFRDFPVIQALVILAAVIILLVNLLADVVYAWVDPRIRYG